MTYYSVKKRTSVEAGGRDTRSGAHCGVVRRAPSSCLGLKSGVGDFRRGTEGTCMNVSLNLHAINHARRHASDFSPGSVTFVGDLEP